MQNTATIHPTASDTNVLTLDQIKVGDKAQITYLDNKTSTMGKTVLRLLELGFVPGQSLQVHAHALLGGDPIAVRLGNSIFALRRCEAALVHVKRTPQ